MSASFYSQPTGSYPRHNGGGNDGAYAGGQPSSSYGPYGNTGGTQHQQLSSSQWQQQPSKSALPHPQQAQQKHSADGSGADTPNFWNPATASAMMSAATKGGLSNDAMFDIASSASRHFIARGSARFIPGLEKFMGALRTYFAVDNRYVQRKMRKIIFPFIHRDWRRTEVEVKSGPEGDQIIYALPHSDENAPDLYLPFMSIVTYVLLAALLYGASGKFNPEVLPDVMTKCFVTQTLEVLSMKFGLYTMQTSIAFLDLFSYTGYKYLGLCINLLIGLAFGWKGYYIALLWTATSVSYYVLKVMANNIPRHTAATGPKREFMVIGFAASQLVSMWFLSETKFLF